jgi:hypothetical protein
MSTTDAQPSPRLAGNVCLAGASAFAALAAVTQLVQSSTDVPKDQWSYPWSSGTAIGFFLFAAGLLSLFTAGIVGLRRSGVTGTTWGARRGLAAALTGNALLVAGHLASIPVRDQLVDDTWPRLVGGILALGTVLTCLGFLAAGWATMRERIWDGWRRFIPGVIGLWAAALICLQFTPILPMVLAIYALCFVVLGVALSTTARTVVPATSAPMQQA